MEFPKLYEGKLIKRYKRFLADVELNNGEIITAHVPNSGAMTSTIEAGCKVWVSHHDNPKRKLAYTLELSDVGSGFVCVNTNWANKIAIEAIQNGAIKELNGYESLKPEQRYGKNSRIDILLENDEQKCYVEVKSVTLRFEDTFAFPDAVTTRGTKHLHELIEMKQAGHRAVMLYAICRSETLPFRIAHEIDANYAKAFKEAKNAGVEILAYQAKIDTSSIVLSDTNLYM
jgi:sugar fermentation stimulation protein A